jgi:hypothetical protein
MTVSSNVNQRFTIGQLVELGMKRAGLLNLGRSASTDEKTYGRQQLELILADISTYGVLTRVADFHDLTVEDGEQRYELPENVADVIGLAKYIAAGEDTEAPPSETTVTLISRGEWQDISSRDATGAPMRAYIDKSGDTLEAWFWPIPDEAGTVRFMVEREWADADADTATLDLPRHWSMYIVTQLAMLFADSGSLPEPKVSRLAVQSGRLLTMARSKSKTGLPTQLVVDHRTG